MADNRQDETFVIAGASLAGATTASALRDEGFEGRIVLVGEEAERPYERPPLSKDYLQGKSEKEKIYVHPKDWYASHDVELVLETKVSDADGRAHEVTLSDGRRVEYSKLVRAGMNVNVWDVTDPIQALIRERQPVDPQKLADVDVPLEDVSP